MSNNKPTLNQADIELLKQFFPTKFEIDQKIDSSLLATKKRLDQKYDKVIRILDKVMGELIKKRQEQIVLSQHSEDHTNKIELLEKAIRDHKKQITSLESSVTANA